jgi:hypothetical protein
MEVNSSSVLERGVPHNVDVNRQPHRDAGATYLRRPSRPAWSHETAVSRSLDDQTRVRGAHMGKWIAIGLAIGVAIGAMYDNIAVGIGIGVALGIALHYAQRSRK